jgi:hypothetical protein
MPNKRLVIKVSDEAIKTINFMKVVTKKTIAEIIEMALQQLSKKKLTRKEWTNLREWFDKKYKP